MNEILEFLYKNGIYSKEDLKTFVLSNSISIPDYVRITGEDFI